MGKRQYKTIPFDGKMITSVDPMLLNANDFSVLDNFRYTTVGVQGIKPLGGMTKINTSALSSFPKLKSGIHFKKDYPTAESHVLVQALNSGETDSNIYDNETAIPSAGAFNAAAVSSGVGSNIGRFNNLPDGSVGFFNQANSLLWGGKEVRCSGLNVFNPDKSWDYDYTDIINNSLATAGNVATMHSVPATVDANTKALWHFDNSPNDATVGAHNLIATNITYTATNAPYGTHWAVFNGSSSTMTMTDHADINLSGGVFTLDFTIRLAALTSPSSQIYYQQTDSTHYFAISVTASGLLRCRILNATDVLGSSGFYSTSALATNTTYRIRLVENGDNWYWFIDGSQAGYLSSTGRAANYTGDLAIGGVTLQGNMDEVRISNAARSTTDYLVDIYAFGSQAECHAYIRANRPIQAFKAYVAEKNTSASSSVVGYYWDGAAWTTLGAITDATVDTTRALYKTGIISFASTVDVAQPKMLNGVMGYVYYFVWTGLNAVTVPTISQITLDAPVQSFVDIWDGVPLPLSAFWEYNTTSKYKDYIDNVAAKDAQMMFNGTTWVFVKTTYYNCTPVGGSGNHLYIGTDERAMGFIYTMVRGNENTTATVQTYEYWNGSAWVELDNMIDGTLDTGGTKTLNHSGSVIFNPPPPELEFKTSINNNDTYLYYYRVTFSSTGPDATAYIDEVKYIPVPKVINTFGYGFEWRNRTILINELEGNKDRLLMGGSGSVCTFSGEDSFDDLIGDGLELIAGGSLYHHSSEGIYVYGIVCSMSRTHVLVGTGPADLKIIPISEKYGCVAPNTFEVCIVRVSDKEVKNVAIWRSATCMVACDGTSVYPISDDIEDLYDAHKSSVITSSTVGNEYGRFDLQYGGYHYFYANESSTSINKEKVYSLKKDAWSSAVRTPQLNGIIPVSDIYGNQYSYGMTSTGYLERLEYGNTFDGNAITYRLRTADAPIVDEQGKNLAYKSKIDTMRVLCRSNSSADAITMKHYGDTLLTPFTLSETLSQVKAANRVVISKPYFVKDTKSYFTHSFELSAVMDDISTGFEPFALVVGYAVDDQPDTGT